MERPEHKMKRNTPKSNNNNQGRTEKRAVSKQIIGVDQPFDYDEVTSVTGEEYVQNLRRDGVSIRPYEELKKNVPGFNLLEDKCIWMKAGVINFRICDGENDCHHCSFDQAMRDAMGEVVGPQGKKDQTEWVLQLKERYQIAGTPCIHFKSGRIKSPEICTENYSCAHCGVHRKLYNQKESEAVARPKYRHASGFQIADGYYYHHTHSWIHLEHDGWIRIGIDDFLCKLLGFLDAIALPPIGSFLSQGEVGWVLTRDDHKIPMQSPISGSVFCVNENIRMHPEIVKNSPYEAGWLFLLDPLNLKTHLKGLYFGNECFQWIENEHRNLLEILGRKYERLAATGGDPIDDVLECFPAVNWKRLLSTFIQTKEKA